LLRPFASRRGLAKWSDMIPLWPIFRSSLERGGTAIRRYKESSRRRLAFF
jgi:hypothetical protein